MTKVVHRVGLHLPAAEKAIWRANAKAAKEAYNLE